jgi:hypothetical protein
MCGRGFNPAWAGLKARPYLNHVPGRLCGKVRLAGPFLYQ